MKKDILIGIVLSALVVAIIQFSLIRSFSHYTYKTEKSFEDTIAIKPIVREYGFPVDSFNITRGRIRWNEPLATLLSKKYKVDYAVIETVAQRAIGEFDLRKIRARNKYLVLKSLDSAEIAQYFIYEHSPTEYVVFSLADSIWVEKRDRKIKNVRRYSSATIETSLWNAMIDNRLNPVLANDLSDIFAWTIDFFGLQKGDRFTAIYDEEYVDDTLSIGIGHIYSVVFNHMGKDYYAFQFVQDSVISFFDEQGNSLRKTFLKAPLRFNRISSGFSYSRLHPILKIRRPHTGIDYAAPIGTPVYSIGDGIVTQKKYTKQGGRQIKIKHNSIYVTAYLHLNGYAKGIKLGSHVKQGQLIGYVGKTGLSTGPHLDFRFWKNGKPVNPLKVKAPPVEPIKEFNMDPYRKVMKHWLHQLDSITQEEVPNVMSNV
ncbi:MAG: peptidoglycan DD-metalloendopeptidase family protein [Desulfobacteraceae bacterium]|nr:peptidoglycan DD-metalloendopeptidase family protein [Desulfobacteraceae bacterium]